MATGEVNSVTERFGVGVIAKRDHELVGAGGNSEGRGYSS